MTGRPRVGLASLGGTITMTPTASGVVPTAGAADLTAAVPGLAAIADLEVSTLFTKPGAALELGDVLVVLDWAQGQIASGAAGVVVVQGTDTLEETAFLLDLLWPHDEPLVLTGAMRSSDQLSADGAANLSAAVTAAGSRNCRGLGAVVVMDGLMHAARRVTKSDTSRLSAFQSPDFGPLGRFSEGTMSVGNRVARAAPHAVPGHLDGFVPLVESTLGDHASTLSLLLRRGVPDGVVLAGFGAGHVCEAAADEVSAATIPVVLASRTGGGPVLESTYGFPGSERDLVSRGAIPAGWLPGRKARLLLLVLLANGARPDTVRSEFAELRWLP